MPMWSEVSLDQVPFEKADDCYLVRKDFFYQRPREYSIKFAKPAIFDTGCLTCGNENAAVENYGERYCCSTCQKSLQTPDGHYVELRRSTDGKRIIAHAR